MSWWFLVKHISQNDGAPGSIDTAFPLQLLLLLLLLEDLLLLELLLGTLGVIALGVGIRHDPFGQAAGACLPSAGSATEADWLMTSEGTAS